MRNGGLADVIAGRDIACADRPDVGQLAQDAQANGIRGGLQQA
jgi:hypothetical protein